MQFGCWSGGHCGAPRGLCADMTAQDSVTSAGDRGNHGGTFPATGTCADNSDRWFSWGPGGGVMLGGGPGRRPSGRDPVHVAWGPLSGSGGNPLSGTLGTWPLGRPGCGLSPFAAWGFPGPEPHLEGELTAGDKGTPMATRWLQPGPQGQTHGSCCTSHTRRGWGEAGG